MNNNNDEGKKLSLLIEKKFMELEKDKNLFLNVNKILLTEKKIDENNFFEKYFEINYSTFILKNKFLNKNLKLINIKKNGYLTNDSLYVFYNEYLKLLKEIMEKINENISKSTSTQQEKIKKKFYDVYYPKYKSLFRDIALYNIVYLITFFKVKKLPWQKDKNINFFNEYYIKLDEELLKSVQKDISEKIILYNTFLKKKKKLFKKYIEEENNFLKIPINEKLKVIDTFSKKILDFKSKVKNNINFFKKFIEEKNKVVQNLEDNIILNTLSKDLKKKEINFDNFFEYVPFYTYLFKSID